MPSYFPENNDAKPDDTEVRSLQKINDLLSGGITVSVGEVEVKNDLGHPVPVSGTVTAKTDISATGSLPCVVLGFDTPAGVFRVNAVQTGFPIANEIDLSGNNVPLNVSDRGPTGEASVTPFSSLTSAPLKAANANRKLLTVYNEGSGNLHILYGAGTASTTNYSVKLLTGDYLEINQYTGQVTGIFASAGTARVTEIT